MNALKTPTTIDSTENEAESTVTRSPYCCLCTIHDTDIASCNAWANDHVHMWDLCDCCMYILNKRVIVILYTTYSYALLCVQIKMWARD